MPTKKPVTQIVLTEKYSKKLDYIAKQEDRSKSSQGARIIEQYIDKYEEINGAIPLENKSRLEHC